MGQYHVIQDFFGKTQSDPIVDPDVVSVSAYWILAVVQFKYPLTFRRAKKASFSKSHTDGVETRGVLVITSDCQSVTVSSTKSNHISTLSATLLPGEANYLNEIMPGDYVFCWMMNDEATYLNVLEKLDSGGAANDFLDGLKFVGQCQTIRKVLSVSDGSRTVRFPLTAAGFTALDTQLYYDPALAEKFPALGQIFARYGVDLNKLILEKGEGIDVNTAIPLFLELLLGKGVKQNLGRGNDDARLQATTGLEEAPYAFIVPKVVGTILGQQNQSKPGGALSFVDTLQVIVGVQKYTGSDTSRHNREDGPPGAPSTADLIFMPDYTRGYQATMKKTTTKMMGTFIPQAPQFTNHPVWSVLHQYLNPAVNEMYTTLRVNSQNQVVPTLIVRQLPFTSDLYQGSLDTTRYLSLPRWVIHPALIRGQVDLGRTDALRFNFVHVYAELSGAKGGMPISEQVPTYPPPRDELDVARNGVRGFFQTIPCAAGDSRNGGPEKWMELLSDILMGQHMTMTGNMTMVGIQAPICVGDNAEFDDVVLHIETVSHTCAIVEKTKSFSTTLQVTHGLRASPLAGDLGIYPGTKHDDQTTYDPGITRDDKLPGNQLADIGNTEPTVAPGTKGGRGAF